MAYPMMASKGRVLLWGAALVLLWAVPAHAARAATEQHEQSDHADKCFKYSLTL